MRRILHGLEESATVSLHVFDAMVITNTYMKAIVLLGAGIMMLAGCGAPAVSIPMSPALANDLIGTTTLSSAPVGPISASTLPAAAWEEREAPEPATPTWGARDESVTSR
jgi:hypothetical protein